MHAFYINLDRRIDRRLESEEEFRKMNLDVERFSAVEYSPPSIGCNLSHIEVLKLARSRGYASVMIFEDDFQFIVSKEEWDQLITRLPESYDVVMLSYNLIDATPHNETFDRVRGAQTTSGYIVHSRFYDTLIAKWEEGTRLFKENPAVHWVYLLDQYWKPLQPISEWYSFKTRIGIQRPSFSDLAGQFVAHGC
jgi:GR25 family glycosyltransferase involved in LPS biosynthesis